MLTFLFGLLTVAAAAAALWLLWQARWDLLGVGAAVFVVGGALARLADRVSLWLWHLIHGRGSSTAEASPTNIMAFSAGCVLPAALVVFVLAGLVTMLGLPAQATPWAMRLFTYGIVAGPFSLAAWLPAHVRSGLLGVNAYIGHLMALTAGVTLVAASNAVWPAMIVAGALALPACALGIRVMSTRPGIFAEIRP